jgi:hypothetical protein
LPQDRQPFSGTLQLAITTKGFRRRRRKNNVRNGGQKKKNLTKLLIKLQIRKDEKREKEKIGRLKKIIITGRI